MPLGSKTPKQGRCKLAEKILKAQKVALASAKVDNKGRPLYQTAHRLDGQEVQGRLVYPETAGTWHLYAPAKAILLHNASFEEAARLLEKIYGITVDAKAEGTCFKMGFNVMPTTYKVGKDKVEIPKGRVCIKSFTGQGQTATATPQLTKKVLTAVRAKPAKGAVAVRYKAVVQADGTLTKVEAPSTPSTPITAEAPLTGQQRQDAIDAKTAEQAV
mgnify:CR=1 FL=1